jgi:peptidoglycan/xylan/chitin deacetylase (PgdA/CDA1 family)
MKPALCTALIAVALLASPLPPPNTLVARGPHLSRRLPAVEEAILKALRESGLEEGVERIAADTNGHLVVASLDFATPSTSPRSLFSVERDAWARAEASFRAVPSLSELDLTAHRDRSLPPNKGEAIFTAAITQEEFMLLEKAEPTTAFARLSRVWFHPSLLHPEVPERGPRGPSPPPQTYLEQHTTFWGRTREWVEDLRLRFIGRVRGGVIEGRVYRGNPRRRTMALTFDDGPLPIYTTLLLDTLEHLGVQGTFFLIGQHVQEYPYFARAIVQAGHEVGNHSYHHWNLARLPQEQVWEEIRKTQDIIAQATGVVPHYFRPPGGDYSTTVLRVAQQLGLTTVFWTDNPGDYTNPDPRILELKVFLGASNGGILLLHQGIPETLHALPVIVRILQERRVGLTTVSGVLGP